MSLREEIGYEIYKFDRALNAGMSFEDFIVYPANVTNQYIEDCKRTADKILALPAIKELQDKAWKYDNQ